MEKLASKMEKSVSKMETLVDTQGMTAALVKASPNFPHFFAQIRRLPGQPQMHKRCSQLT